MTYQLKLLRQLVIQHTDNEINIPSRVANYRSHGNGGYSLPVEHENPGAHSL